MLADNDEAVKLSAFFISQEMLLFRKNQIYLFSASSSSKKKEKEAKRKKRKKMKKYKHVLYLFYILFSAKNHFKKMPIFRGF